MTSPERMMKMKSTMKIMLGAMSRRLKLKYLRLTPIPTTTKVIKINSMKTEEMIMAKDLDLLPDMAIMAEIHLNMVEGILHQITKDAILLMTSQAMIITVIKVTLHLGIEIHQKIRIMAPALILSLILTLMACLIKINTRHLEEMPTIKVVHLIRKSMIIIIIIRIQSELRDKRSRRRRSTVSMLRISKNVHMKSEARSRFNRSMFNHT